MLNGVQFRPLDHWPSKRTTNRVDATFRAGYSKTLDDLEYEFSRINAKSIIIQVDGLMLADIRNDGWPRGSWNGGPGVIVSFSSAVGDISMPCDKFGDWRDNLRAIAKSLEALRMVDRYGVTRGKEQYQGWTKLADPNANGMDAEVALLFLAGMTATPKDYLRDMAPATRADLFRKLRIEYHPDRAVDESDRTRREELSAKIGQAQAVLMKKDAA